jgi:aromatic ring-cleaving dioxygenase
VVAPRAAELSSTRAARAPLRSLSHSRNTCDFIDWPMMPEKSAPAIRDPGAIKDYHAHIYYDPATSRTRAERLRERIAAAFPEAKLGRWHDELVGPHPQSMYQVAFPTRMLEKFVPWLMLNRDGLTVLLHPETGDDYTDHSAHAAWFGAMLPLRLDVFGKRK